VTDRKVADKYYYSLALQMKALDSKAVRKYRESRTKDNALLTGPTHQHCQKDLDQ
jgi:hypothetical protein